MSLFDVPPARVAIVALGPSSHDYIVDAEAAGGRHVLFDHVWAVNTYAGVLDHDVLLHMDDLRVQETRAAAGNKKIGAMLERLRRHDKPILTSIAYPEYPTSIAFPLEGVINATDCVDAFDSTIDYGMAAAITIGAKEIHLYGCDYNWRGESEIEPGRASCSYWIGFARARGIKVCVARSSTLMNARGKPGPRFYGYDGADVKVSLIDGRAVVAMEPKPLPDAAEMEQRYDHYSASGKK